MAKSKKKNEVLDDAELEELEDLEDLEDLDDEDEEEEEDVEVEDDDEEEDEDEDEEDEDEDDDEDDEEEEAPPKKSKSKKSTKKSAAKKGRDDGRIGSTELAEAAGTDARTLRIFLRKNADRFPKGEDGRYSWSSLNNKEAKAIVKAFKSGAGEKIKKEGLDKVRSGKKKSASKAGTAKKKRTSKK